LPSISKVALTLSCRDRAVPEIAARVGGPPRTDLLTRGTPIANTLTFCAIRWRVATIASACTGATETLRAHAMSMAISRAFELADGASKSRVTGLARVIELVTKCVGAIAVPTAGALGAQDGTFTAFLTVATVRVWGTQGAVRLHSVSTHTNAATGRLTATVACAVTVTVTLDVTLFAGVFRLTL